MKALRSCGGGERSGGGCLRLLVLQTPLCLEAGPDIYKTEGAARSCLCCADDLAGISETDRWPGGTKLGGPAAAPGADVV